MAVAAVGLAVGCYRAGRMNGGPRRARNHNQQQAAQCQWQQLFVGASEWRCGLKAASPLEALEYQAR